MENKDRQKAIEHLNNAVVEINNAINIYELYDYDRLCKTLYSAVRRLVDIQIITSHRSSLKLDYYTKLNEKPTDDCRPAFKKKFDTAVNAVCDLQLTSNAQTMRHTAGRLLNLMNEIQDIALETGVYTPNDV